jgi:hypothetical protein
MPDELLGGMPSSDQTQGEMPSDKVPMTLEQALAQLQGAQDRISALNKESAKHRKEADTYRKAEEDRKTAEMTELEKAQKAREDAEKRADEAIKAANERMKKAAFIAAASQHNARNPQDAYALAIADGVELNVDASGNVEGVNEYVKSLVEAGRLPTAGAPRAPGLDGGAGGGSRPAQVMQLSDEQRRAARAAGMTDEQYMKYLRPSGMPDMSDKLSAALNKEK